MSKKGQKLSDQEFQEIYKLLEETIRSTMDDISQRIDSISQSLDRTLKQAEHTSDFVTMRMALNAPVPMIRYNNLLQNYKK